MAEFSGGEWDLPIGRHVSDIVGSRESMGKNFKTQEPEKRYEFDVQVWVNGKWIEKKVWTTQKFSRPGTSAKLLTKLTKLTLACQRPTPQTTAIAEEWGPDQLQNCRFLWVVDTDEETGEQVERFVKYVENTPKEVAPVVAAPAPPVVAAAPISDPATAPFAPEARELVGAGVGAPPTPRPSFD